MEVAILFVSSLSTMTTSDILLDLNIPICAIAAALFVTFLKVRTPQGTLKEKLRRIDWL